MRKPEIRCVTEVAKDAQSCTVRLRNGRLVPARGYGWNQLRPLGRFKASWLVFTGKADAVTYPGQLS